MKKYILALIAFISIIGTVNASDCVSDGYTYYAKTIIGGHLTNSKVADTNRYLFTKESYSGDLVGYGFCLAPKKPANSALAGSSNNLHKCINTFKPKKNNPYSLAMAYAYQYLYNNNYFVESSSKYNTSDLVLTPLLTFRWIASIYGKLDVGGGHDQENLYISSVYKKSMNSDMDGIIDNYFSGASKTAAIKAKELVNAAISVADNSDMSKIWQPEFTTTVIGHELNKAKTRTRVTIQVQATNDVSPILWDRTTVKCNSGCRIKEDETTNCSAAGTDNCRQYVVAVDNTTNCNFGIKFTISHNDKRDVGSFLMQVEAQASPNSHQKFILARTVGYDGGGKVEVPVSNPVCEGTPGDPCSYSDGAGGRYYYDLQGNGSYDPTNYRAQCVHECSQPSVGEYYCRRPEGASLDESGPLCDFEQYKEECTYCGENKAKCEATPDTPECITYWQECPNCNPSISMPGTCSDFNTESELTGTVSDINLQKTSCNPSEKPVKGCVVGGNDAAGNSYMVDIPELRDNQYCHLYCYEEYKFNVPTAQRSTSGGYFNLSMQVTGTRNCYVGTPLSAESTSGVSNIVEINFERFMREIVNETNNLFQQLGVNEINSSMINNSYMQFLEYFRGQIGNLNKLIDDKSLEEARKNVEGTHPDLFHGTFNSDIENEKNKLIEEEANEIKMNLKERVINTINEIEKKVNDIQECTNPAIIKNDMIFEPKIEYDYQDYKDKYNVGTFSKVGEEKVVSSSSNYCYGSTDPSYNCHNIGSSLEANNSYWNSVIGSQFAFHSIGYSIASDTPYQYTGGIDDNVDDKYKVPVKYINCTKEEIREVGENPYPEYSDEYHDFENKYGNQKYIKEKNPYAENTEDYYKYEQQHPIVDYELNCNIPEVKINRAVGFSKSITKQANFMPNRGFKTYHQYGTIVTGDPCVGTGFTDCLWTRLPETALPVELKTGKGAFQFSLYFNDIGQFGDGALGRLVGSSNSVLNSYNELPDDKKCSINENVGNGPSSNFGTLTQEVGYVCAYVNNCDNCNVSCTPGGGCTLEECDGPDCPVECKTCIFDGDNTTFKYRTISLNNIFPNTCTEENKTDCRNEGYNWNYGNSARTPTNLKAQKTVEEIQSVGENVYESDKVEYSYTLTPANLRALREYNKAAKTYANTTIPKNGVNALQCEQEPYSGITYSVRCKSTFLRDGENEGLYFTTNKINNDFILWSETDNCLNGACLSRKDGIGPSWK